jgi:hypothetical protein
MGMKMYTDVDMVRDDMVRDKDMVKVMEWTRTRTRTWTWTPDMDMNIEIVPEFVSTNTRVT